MFTVEEIRDIVQSYEDENESTYVIAKRYDTYPNKISRVLSHQGIKLKDKSNAQKLALKGGRSIHPTEGKIRELKTKIKISESISSHWKNLTEDEQTARSEKARENWYKMTDSEREEMHRMAMKAVRNASKFGSKVELFLHKELVKLNYNVIFHKKGLLSNPELEVDLFLPHINTAIEIDGPSHFIPIWGEDKLQKHVNADSDKSGLLLAGGYCIIRLKYMLKSLSDKSKRDILSLIVEQIQKIEQNFPKQGYRFIEIEVK